MSLKSFIESNLPNVQIKAESVASQSSYTTNFVGFAWGAMTFNQWVMAITLLLGLATFVVNWYYKAKQESRARELHDKRMKDGDG